MGVLDCRGLACPEPVLRTKQAIEEPGAAALAVLVDNDAARENVRRFAESQGWSVTVEPAGPGQWRLSLGREGACPEPAPPEATGPEAAAPTALLILSDRVGPEPELGAVLMRAFLSTLTQASRRPEKLLFLNRGVHLTTEDSPVLDVLGEVERAGVEILSCGTCLEFFGKRDRLAVGRVSNMYDTVETLTGTHRVVTIT
ncbi:MAG: sulfurtransferase-like selenium metabolism protein YedF [Deferrisomatales bacterium]